MSARPSEPDGIPDRPVELFSDPRHWRRDFIDYRRAVDRGVPLASRVHERFNEMFGSWPGEAGARVLGSRMRAGLRGAEAALAIHQANLRRVVAAIDAAQRGRISPPNPPRG